MTLKYHPYPKIAPHFIERQVNLERDKRLATVIALRENERLNMNTLFISAITGHHQEEDTETAVDTTGMTPQKASTPAIKMPYPEPPETIESHDETPQPSQVNGKINSHQTPHQEEIHLNHTTPKRDRRLEL